METLKDSKRNLCFIIKIIVLAAFLVCANNALAQFEADFQASPRSGYAPLKITFTDQSQGQIFSWGWSFPGGSPSTASGKGPHTVTYQNPGTYNVSLTIGGSPTQYPPLSDTKTKTNYIKVYKPEPDKDYGDAPDDGTGKYPTLKANNGACHIIDDSIYLGASVDADDDGQPDDQSEGDDNNDDSDDEDGVVIPTLVAGDSAYIKVTAHGSGYLNAWIDFNQDRDWEDESEHVFKAVPLTDGMHTLATFIPETADTGKTYSRFRFSKESELPYAGKTYSRFPFSQESESHVSFGEVEDYLVYIPQFILAFEHDSLALVALYNSTDGPNWDENAHWLIGPVNSWYGITVYGNRVTSIHLSSNQLTGSIPSELGNLSNLEYLDLVCNQLTGIPPELGNLSNLQRLSLYESQLTGTIPPELGNLSNLKSLGLSINQLTGSIPSELGNLVNLENLDLYDNLLSSTIPPELGNLSNLKNLALAFNQLTGTIPPELGNLSNLEDLHLGINQLTGTIPTELGNLSNLENLLFGENQLTGTIPAELGNLANLELLILSDNMLTGSIPAELGYLVNLTGLYLENNQLSGPIPPELGNLVNLHELYLNSNLLIGSIPSSLSNLTNLSDVYDNNDFRWNGLYTNDNTLRTFLNNIQDGGDWESTQTIAPKNISCGSITDVSVTVSWSPIPYTANTGGYKVNYSTNAGGPYTEFGMTADKTASSLTVTGLNPETLYYFMVKTQTNPHSNNNNTVVSEMSNEVSAETLEPAAVEPEDEKKIPDSYALYQNHPNPFNLETEISYDVPKSAQVNLTIYNMLGQPVCTLVDKKMPAGSHQVIWDAQDNTGQVVPSGIYIYILKSDSFTEKRKALLMK